MRRFSFLVGVWLSCLAGPSAAQDAPVDAEPPGDASGADGPASSSDAGVPSRTPPEARVLPAVEWPASLPLPSDSEVEAMLLIGRDGRAQLVECELERPACDAIAAALLEAEFTPAQVDGIASAARVRVRFALRPAPAPAPAPADAPPSAAPPSPHVQPAPSPSEGEPSGYGAQARVEATPPTAHALTLEQMRELPGAFGDPFRVIDSLPGVVPVLTGLPYVYVRGAPPAATAYFFDDVALPVLFHLALGPAVVHPAMVGPIDFYPGVAPARYGRKTGGVVAGQAAYRPLKPGVHGELELRLVDLQGYVATPIRDRGRVEIAGRYGYPGLAIKLFESSAVVQYWDYQLRTVIPLSAHAEASVIAIGSYDLIGERRRGRVERELELQFHRVEARLVERHPGFSIGTAISAGFERSALGDEVAVEALRLGPKLWIDTRLRKAALRFGADMLASSGKLVSLRDEFGGGDAIDLGDNPAYRSATGRNVVGAYAELRWPMLPRLDLEAGLRGDVWITGGDAQGALEPRLLLRWQAHERVALHGAFGLAYQPAVFLIPLPGISDVALDRGLQRAIQSEVGARVDLPQALTLETKLFAHFYSDMLSFEALDDGDIECAGEAPQPAPGFDPGSGMDPGAPIDPVRPPSVPDPSQCGEDEGFARLSARAYGAEFLLRRDYSERLSGWLSYTLSKADAHSDEGRKLTPNFDVRHVGNLVLQWRVTSKWHVALRGYGQSGRFPFASSTAADPRERVRLPPFFRGDLQVSRLWPRAWGELRFSFDWLNFTFQREPLGWNCSDPSFGFPGQPAPSGQGESACRVEYLEFPITLPMLGVRGTF